jgi:hypothetical protein
MYIFFIKTDFMEPHQLYSVTEFLENTASTYVTGLETTYDVTPESDYVLIFPVLPYAVLMLVATCNALRTRNSVFF